MNFEIKQVSSLNRIFLDGECEFTEIASGKAFKNERFSYQLALKSDDRFEATVKVVSDLSEYIRVRAVGNVPSELPCYPDFAEFTERSEAGLFPDVLFPVDGNYFVKPFKWFSLWITVDIPKEIKADDYPITVKILKGEEELASEIFTLTVLDEALPEQKLIYTQWFHGDCIADYYNVPVFSEEHWRLLESFISAAARSGINMLLTPIFTPPLDTNIGGERTTIQLVDVKKNGEEYSFNFDKFRRWVALCRQCGIKYFEISHLFSQWGAIAAPKIIADVDGEPKRIFGWETEAAGEEYSAFLHAFLPKLIEVIKELKAEDCTYFHISDEPSENQLDTYSKAKNVVAELLRDFPIIDALSEYEFYESGLIRHPIPSTSAIDEFIEKGFENRWTYYCCGQGGELSNRFFSMPLAATRIIGVQLYLHDIEGFLQWGFNFYNSAKSLRHINPYEVTDADCAFPSGDSFVVYPYADGAIMSIRGEAFYDALQDMRALELAEYVIGKDEVAKALKDKFGEIKFRSYPRGTTAMLEIREFINNIISENV